MKNVYSTLDSICPKTASAWIKTYFSEITLLVLAIKNVVVVAKYLKILGK